MTRAAAARAWPYAAVAAVAGLSLARGPFSGHPLYFRDLSVYFFPLRRFVLDGLRAGALRFWNPYVHEGEPLALSPVGYPFDLLQMLRPDEAGISVVLALHVPLAAVWMMALARRGLGLTTAASAGAGLVYALGGFALSTVNLYIYVQALAWAPAAILGLMQAARGDRRAVALAALAVGVLLSTTGAEIAVQAIAIGLALTLPLSFPAAGRVAAALALGAALAAPATLVVARVAAESARAAGFPPEVSLAHSVHPMTLAQVVVAGFHGDPWRLTDRWWGGNFFPRGFPYFLSLYLGAAVLALATVGALQDRGPRRRLALLAVMGLLLALGRWGIAGGIVETFEAARRFRYPSKAFFTVHAAVALLAALGLDALARSASDAWRRLALVALAAGTVLATAPLWPHLAPARAQWFAAGFFPPALPGSARLALLDWILRDAATGGAFALAAAGLAALVRRGTLAPKAATLGLLTLVAADLLRAGAGLNPGTSPEFFSASPEVARHYIAWRGAGRVFTCTPDASEGYAMGRALRPDHERWTFAVHRDALAPGFNVGAGVRSALSPDLTMLVPPDRLIDPADAGCASVDRLMARLRLAGVAHVVSLDPLAHPDLLPQVAERPPELAPVTIFAYALRDPLPMVSVPRSIEAASSAAQARARSVDPAFDPRNSVVVEAPFAPSAGGQAHLRSHEAGRLQVDVATEGPALLMVREGYAAGWKASVDGTPTTVLRANGRHMAVAVPTGTHAVRLDYDPPGFRGGVGLWLLAAVFVVTLAGSWGGGRHEKDAAARSRRS